MPNMNEEVIIALGKIPSGVGIITVTHNNEEYTMMASWFQQVAFEPPLISVAFGKDRPILKAIQEKGSFALNLFAATEKELFGKFSKPPAQNTSPFEGLDIEKTPSGNVILKKALSYFEGNVLNTVPTGDHVLVIAEVTSGRTLQEGQPYVHIRKSGLKY